MLVKKRRLRVKLKKTKRFRIPKSVNPKLDFGALADVEIDEDDLERELCKESFYDFVRTFWDTIIPEKPVWNWHIRYLCKVMQKVAENLFLGNDKLHDLLINIPPGTTKSTIISVLFPAWVWTRMPTARFICVSFRYPLALRLSAKTRDVIKSDKYKRLFPEVEIRSDQDAKHHFANTAGGERYCAGSGGNIIGNHAHFVIVDDPIDPDSVVSDAELQAVNIWIEETLSGRKVSKTATVTVLVMQRLHMNDPSARMLSAGNVYHVKLPAVLKWQGKPTEVKPKYLTKYYKNGLLDPIRLPTKVLDSLAKKPRAEYLVSGQYLQDPVPPGGGMFKTDNLVMLDYHDACLFTDPALARKNFLKVVRFWDKAITEGGGAFTVGVKMGVTRSERIVIIDVIRFQHDSWKRERRIKETAKRDGRNCVVGLEQEPGSGGLESNRNTIRRLMGFVVKTVKPTQSKTGESRADAFSQHVNSGNVLVCPGLWRKAYVEELRHFPVSTYKDQVDASSGAFTLCWSTRRVCGGLKAREKTKSEVATKPVDKKTQSTLTKFRGRNTSKLRVI